MSIRFIKQNILPAITALIFGCSIVVLSIASEKLPTFAFTGARSLVAAIFLYFVSKFAEKRNNREINKDNQKLIVGGIICGICLTMGSVLQQAGVADTSAGKTGFLTALYVVLVPVIRSLSGKKAKVNVWIGVVLAVTGLYFLCINGHIRLVKADIYLILCALFFALQIIAVERFVGAVGAVKLSCAQFTVMAVLCFIISALTEKAEPAAYFDCIGPILFVGVVSSGIAFTLQNIAQEGTDTNIVAMWLSLESVFSVIAGAVFLNERMSIREYFGCVLMFAAVILAQINTGKKKTKCKEALSKKT